MDPTKVVVLGAGPGLGRSAIDAMMKDGTVVELKHHGVSWDFEGDSILLPRGYPTTIPQARNSRNTGAARIKRNAKQRRNRKGK